MESHGGNRRVRWIHILFKGEDTRLLPNSSGDKVEFDSSATGQQQQRQEQQQQQHQQQNYQVGGFLPPGVILPPQQQPQQTIYDQRAVYTPTTSRGALVSEDEAVGGDHDIPEEEDNDEYLLEFRRRGWDVMRVPVLRFVYKQLDKLAELLDKTKDDREGKFSNGLIITSPRVVEALSRALDISVAKRDNLKKFNPHLIFVIGEKSGLDLMRKLNVNFNRDSISTGNISALRDYILTCVTAHVAPLMIYPKSDRADTTLYVDLSQNKRIRVQPIVVYDTKPASDLEPSKHGLSQFRVDDPSTRLIVNLIFFSPSGVEAAGDSRTRANILTDICDQFPHIKDITFKYSAIGETTRAALIARRSDVFCVAPQPNARSFADNLEYKIYNANSIVEGHLYR